MNDTNECQFCHFQNPDLSVYCQHCGKELKRRKLSVFTKDSSNKIFFAGAGHKGASIAPLGGMAIQGQAKQFSDYKYNQPFPKIKITPLSDGSWFCPLCGDKNKGETCMGCGFPINGA